MNKKINLPGYVIRPREELALRYILSKSVSGARALLLEGAPGVGKTFLGESLAEGQGWEKVYYLCHSWTSDQELFEGVNLIGAVLNDSEKVIKDGVLLEAAKKSLSQKVVLIIDELDKAPERVDNLLLDFLQTGRVPTTDGLMKANLDNLIVFITSNGMREVSAAFKRRCRRLAMQDLPNDVLDRLITEKCKVAKSIARKVRHICQQCAACDNEKSSLQEMVNLCEELKLTQSEDEIMFALEGWAVRGPKGTNWLHSHKGETLLAELNQLVHG